jgi:MFS family permease
MYKKKLIILFLLLAPMYQITADIYIPSLPFIQADLKTSTTNTQLSLTLFLSGASIAQIFYGNLSDFIGTKTLLIFGLILTAISSIICANTTNIIIFNINKLLQGIGVTSITLYRVILFSNFNNHELNKIF